MYLVWVLHYRNSYVYKKYKASVAQTPPSPLPLPPGYRTGAEGGLEEGESDMQPH